MSLVSYRKKRNFKATPEPAGGRNGKNKFRFVVQKHHASHLHYDFRLELGGTLKSWAVPKGPPEKFTEKRLAVHVEDHPVDYINFKGTIPKGNYGAGKVEIWDKGYFTPIDGSHQPVTEKQALAALKKGELKFELTGKKLKGAFVLVQMKKQDKNWLLIREKGRNKASSTTIKSLRKGGSRLSSYIKPMLATLSDQPFNDPDWIYEIKWDGYRAIAETGQEQVRFYSRNGLDFSDRFSTLTAALKKVKVPAIIDGEIVLLNEQQLPDFQKLQDYENNTRFPLVYYCFDLLSLHGENTEELPLLERKKLLKKLLGKNRVIRYCDHVVGEGIPFLEKAREAGLEGIIAKQKQSLYTEGIRSKEWLKLKNVQSSEAVIVGFTKPKGSRQYFGSLILANKKGRRWQYRGHVGTGFNEQLLQSLYRQMTKLKTVDSPFSEKVPANGPVTWLVPKLVADIAYTEVTRDGIFRHPSFLRLREEKSISQLNEEIVKKQSAQSPRESIRIGRQEVMLTNQQKIFWPAEGYTKGDLIQYYERIADILLPHLKNRPLSLLRNPNGILDKGFFHKDAGENAPAFAEVYKVNSESSGKVIDYLVCNNKATLLYIANLGCIEFNPWNSTARKPDHPTWMVIDIDPSEKNKFTEVVDVARATYEILKKAGVNCYCKTSGATGLHVYVPMKNKYPYDQVRDFGQLIATMVHEQLPGTTSLERSLKKRGSHIYLDYLQNRPGQTLAVAYSLRPRAGAPVSTPLEWKEVKHSLDPLEFNIRSIFKRIQKKGDIFLPVLKDSVHLPSVLKKLGA